MTKLVTCLRCRRTFRVEGASGTMEEADFSVVCPYGGCRARNKVEWAMDGSFRAIPINKQPDNAKSGQYPDLGTNRLV